MVSINENRCSCKGKVWAGQTHHLLQQFKTAEATWLLCARAKKSSDVSSRKLIKSLEGFLKRAMALSYNATAEADTQLAITIGYGIEREEHAPYSLRD